MRKLRLKSPIALVLVACLMAACSENELRKAAEAAANIKDGVIAAHKVTTELYSSGFLAPSEAEKITLGLLAITRANRTFNDRASQLSQMTPEARTELRVLFGSVLGAIDQLNRDGVLTLGNDEARQKLAVALKVIQTAANVIWSLLERK